MDQPEPPMPKGLRFLKWLVIVLTLTMIAGVITVVTVLVIRIPQVFGGVGARLPGSIVLPAGSDARAVTFGPGWVGVVVSDGDGQRFLIFTPDGRLRQEVALPAAE